MPFPKALVPKGRPPQYRARLRRPGGIFMHSSSGDPVATVSEAEASGEIAALYRDIRATLGVPVVNLIWRHLAAFPGGLDWAWQSLRPLYARGWVAAEARALREGLNIPVLPGLTLAGFRALGLGERDIAQIMTLLRSYERSNAMNMIALGALLARLDGVSGSLLPASPPLPGETGAVAGTMPDLLSLDDMAPPVRDLVVALNAVGGRDDILASMYRHLANWPPYLALIQTLITPFGQLEPVIGGVIVEGRRRAAGLVADLADPAQALDADMQAELRRVLNRFIDGPIGKMIAIVPLIRQAMPQ